MTIRYLNVSKKLAIFRNAAGRGGLSARSPRARARGPDPTRNRHSLALVSAGLPPPLRFAQGGCPRQQNYLRRWLI